MSTSTQNVFKNAYDNIVNTPEAYPAAGRSFLIGFAANVVLSLGSPWAGVLGGAASATASLIDAAIRPAIHSAFGKEFRNTLAESLVRNIVVLSILKVTMAAVAPLVGVSVGFSILSTLFIRGVYGIATGQSMGRTQFIPVRC